MNEKHRRPAQSVAGLVGNVCLDLLISVVILAVGVGLMAVVSHWVAAGQVWPIVLLIGLVSWGLAKYMAAVFDEE